LNQRLERVSAEIRQILAEVVARGEIKDPRVQQAGIITFTHVRVTGDLREARALFMVHGADEAALERVQEGLESASGYLRRLIGKQLRLRTIPTLSFEIDRVFAQEEKVDALLREIEPAKPEPEPEPEPDDQS
jgi:ribosome-binding factor A